MSTRVEPLADAAEPLGVGAVLIDSLPFTLQTDQAPDVYTVEAVFTRRVSADEIEEIMGDGTRELLAKNGYSRVRLAVSDRRLEVIDTTLEELRDGLATAIADRLAEISAGTALKREAAQIRFAEAARKESARAAAVQILANSITFACSDHEQNTHRSTATTQLAEDPSLINDREHESEPDVKHEGSK